MRASLNSTNNSILQRVLAAAGLAAGAAGVFAVAWFDPVTAGFFPQCPLYSMTGLACPGCGLTRGFHALFHGDVLTALDYNALLPFYALFFAYAAASLLMTAARGRGLQMVDALAGAWGVSLHADGKTVWAVLNGT